MSEREHDIRTEAEVRRTLADLEASVSETMEAVARLCHQINNPLTSLMGRTQLMRRLGDQDPKVQKTADTIEESAQRIAEFVRELSNLARAHRKPRRQP